MSEHTPTPWTIKRGSTGLSVGIRGADNRQVATSSWHDSSTHYPTEAVTIANFESIIQAVNTYDLVCASIKRRMERCAEAGSMAAYNQLADLWNEIFFAEPPAPPIQKRRTDND